MIVQCFGWGSLWSVCAIDALIFCVATVYAERYAIFRFKHPQKCHKLIFGKVVVRSVEYVLVGCMLRRIAGIRSIMVCGQISMVCDRTIGTRSTMVYDLIAGTRSITAVRFVS